MHLCTLQAIRMSNSDYFSSADKPLEVSVNTISSTSLHITAQPPPGLDIAEVECNLTAKDNSSYIRTVSLNNTTNEGAQRLIDLAPYTNYTATCLVFKDGVDRCYIGSDTTQTYTDSTCLSAPISHIHDIAHIACSIITSKGIKYLIYAFTISSHLSLSFPCQNPLHLPNKCP